MRQVLIASLVVALGACAADEAVELATEEQAATSTVIGEKWDSYAPGTVHGQGGWVGNCVVTEGIPPNRYLRCAGGASASRFLGEQGAGSFTMLVDMGPNANVVDGTHGKLSLEGGSGRAFQLIAGACTLRVASRMGPETATLLTIPGCVTPGDPPGPKYRVICNWATGGTKLSCGASVLPNDPTTYIDLAVPPIFSFHTAALSTFALPGATLFDKLYIWRN